MKALGRWLTVAGIASLAGCAAPARSLTLEQRSDLRRRATLTLTSAATDPSAAVRVRAVEALQETAPAAGKPFFVDLLSDPYRGVRFAALMALGTLRCREALDRIRTAAEDADPSVRAAALFALHRLGDTRRTSELAELLCNNPRPDVRANTAIVLGRLGEPGTVKLLAADLKDRSESTRLQVLEAMALLGHKPAIKELVVLGLGSAGQKMVFAIEALARARRAEARAMFESQFETGTYDEVKLAAAAGLARLGDKSGAPLAIERLRNFRPSRGIEDDPPEQQARRIKTLAAGVLEAAGDPANLWVLDDTLGREPDASVRVAVARAALAILGRDPLESGGAAAGGN